MLMHALNVSINYTTCVGTLAFRTCLVLHFQSPPPAQT